MHLRELNHAYPLLLFARPATSCCFYRQGNRWRDRERESWWIRSAEEKNETEREVSFTGFSTRACPRAEDACLRAQKLVDKEHVALDAENPKTRRRSMPSRRFARSSFLLLAATTWVKQVASIIYWRVLYTVRNKCARADGDHVTAFSPMTVRKRKLQRYWKTISRGTDTVKRLGKSGQKMSKLEFRFLRVSSVIHLVKRVRYVVRWNEPWNVLCIRDRCSSCMVGIAKCSAISFSLFFNVLDKNV